MKKTIQTIGLLIAGGLSAWACGETANNNFPLAFFFGVVMIGTMVAAFDVIAPKGL